MAAELLTDASRATDANANPLPGATWTFYATGTTTLQAVYTDAALTTPHTNPVVADAGGKFAPIYFDSALSYRGVMRSAAGVTVYDIDPINEGILAQIYDKLYQIRAVTDYATPALADAAGGTLYVAEDINSSLATGAAMLSSYWGPGQITTADGNKRGKWFSRIKVAPTSFGNHESPDTAFNGDLSHSIFQVEHRITGPASLGQPTTGYSYIPEAYPFYGVLYNASGWNEGTGGNEGRTAACFFRVDVKQAGQGDAMAYNASGFVTGARAGATHFLANPAVALFAGDLAAGSSGVYLNPREIIAHDRGYDVACVGDVLNMDRTNNTGALACWWAAYRVQSVGTKAIDSLLSATGPVVVGIDLAMSTLDFGATKAAISLKANDRIYFGNAALASGNLPLDIRTTSFNGDYIEYNSVLGGTQIVAGGTSVLQIKPAQVTAPVPIVAAAGLRVKGTTATAAAGELALGISTATTATAGASGAVPAQVLGYLVASLAGTPIKVPYYAA